MEERGKCESCRRVLYAEGEKNKRIGERSLGSKSEGGRVFMSLGISESRFL